LKHKGYKVINLNELKKTPAVGCAVGNGYMLTAQNMAGVLVLINFFLI